MKYLISMLVTIFTIFFLLDLYFLFLSNKNLYSGSIKDLYNTRKSLLASNINTKKIIIDSGSNGLFGFKSSIIEDQFQIPVINLSDMAGVPLRHKISRIMSVTQKGDIVILPLEYSYFFNEDIDQNYMIDFFFKYSHYYKYLSIYDKYDFIENFNFGSFFSFGLKSIEDSFLFSKNTQKLEYSALNYLFDSNSFSLHGDYLNRSTEFDIVGDQNETRLILNSLNDKSNSSLSENIRNLLTIVDHGVELYITFPAVTTLQKDYILKNLPFLEILKNQLLSHGLNVIGSPSDFIFDRNLYGYDTPYHLSVEGAKTRTDKLISLIGDKITPSSSHSSVIKQLCSLVEVDLKNNLYLDKNLNEYTLKSYEFDNLGNKSFCKLSNVRYTISPKQNKDNYLIMVNPSDDYILCSDDRFGHRVSDFIFYFNPEKSLDNINFNVDIKLSANVGTNSDFSPKIHMTPLSFQKVTYVAQLYQSYLNRDPDISGFLNYLESLSLHLDFDKLKGDFLKGAENELKNL
jgi:hypothetical protein